jgi:Ni,Fe-hydrogenase III large subunit
MTASVRFRPSPEVASADLRRRAQALFDDGFRLALVAAQREGAAHRVMYLFTAPGPDRRVELTVRADAHNTIPSLALQSFPAGRFERALYEAHGILATSSSADAASRPGPPDRDPDRTGGWEERARGRRVSAVLPRVERLVPNAGVAHALALCLAVEDAHGRPVAPAVAAARAVLLELERVQSHLHAAAVMCARAGLAKYAAEAINTRRTVVELSRKMSGDRLLHRAIVPGGVRLVGLPEDYQIESLEWAVTDLARLMLSDPTLISTYRGRWLLTRQHAAQTGALGFVARASGTDVDARRDHPFHPPTAQVSAVTASAGDAFARLEVRMRELVPSLRLIRGLLPAAVASAGEAGLVREGGPLCGVGLTEGPHGTVVHRLELTADGRVANLRVVDPSFLNRSVRTVCQRGPHDENGSMVESGLDLPPLDPPA